MVELSPISSVLSSLRFARDTSKIMVNLPERYPSPKLIEIQSRLNEAILAALEAQDERITLLERVRQLEMQVVGLKVLMAKGRASELLGRVDGFDQDKAESKRDE
jgi:hypothetical protein